MVTPDPALVPGGKGVLGDPTIAGYHPADSFAHNTRSHPMNDAKERLFGQHCSVNRGDGGGLGFVAGHAAEVNLKRGSGAGGQRGAVPTWFSFFSARYPREGVWVSYHAHGSGGYHNLPIGPNFCHLSSPAGG